METEKKEVHAGYALLAFISGIVAFFLLQFLWSIIPEENKAYFGAIALFLTFGCYVYAIRFPIRKQVNALDNEVGKLFLRSVLWALAIFLFTLVTNGEWSKYTMLNEWDFMP